MVVENDDELAAYWVKRSVEALSEVAPMWSRSAYTHRRSPHVQFFNGFRHEEGASVPEAAGDVFAVARQTFNAIEAYRSEISGPVVLTWRIEPEIVREGAGLRLYCRLCFEPDIGARAEAA